MVYLIHLATPYKHAKHYLGYCADGNLKRRFQHHKEGTGSNFLRVVNEQGIDYEVVRTWEGKGRDFERFLKNGGHVTRYCPVCRRLLEL